MTLVAAAVASCGPRDLSRGSPPAGWAGGQGGEGGFGVGDGSGPPSPDADGLCGNKVHAVITDAPNLYFVLDASGSMSAPAPGGGSRYSAVRGAAIDLVRSLGRRISAGAAIFPHKATDIEPCRPGAQVFATTPGDAYTGPDGNGDGPTTTGFKKSTDVSPFGGTPTAATLTELYGELTALPGETIVLLATDGGPNCNEDAVCAAEACIANIEEQGACDPDENCCAPGAPAGPSMCIDEEPTLAAIGALKAKGIKVYIIGIPGSEAYAGVLDAMAFAGGTAQLGATKYYSVTDLKDLGDVLGDIASVVVSCDFEVADPPPEPDLTNVYLDQELLSYGPPNGWTWASASVVRLLGGACDRVKHAEVKQVQIVSGCPTEVAK
jgi:hypothetical protein